MDKGPYGRKDRLIKEKRHDVYQTTDKWPEPTLCPECGALFVNGRWSWNKSSEKVHKTVCPACQRIADCYPAGHIEIKGEFFGEMSILDREPRSMSVTTTTLCITASIQRTHFFDILNRYPGMTVELIGFISKRLRKLNQFMVEHP